MCRRTRLLRPSPHGQGLCAWRPLQPSLWFLGGQAGGCHTCAAEIAHALDPDARQRLSAGDSTKGARLHDWAYCELANLQAGEDDESRSGLWTRGLLIRRNIADGDLAFLTTWCPAGTSIEALVKVEGHCWVGAGNPSYGCATCSAPHRPILHHRMVAMATSASGHQQQAQLRSKALL